MPRRLYLTNDEKRCPDCGGEGERLFVGRFKVWGTCGTCGGLGKVEREPDEGDEDE